MLIHSVYPSSKVGPEVIAAYGWQFVEEIPTTINDIGRLAPTPERSSLHVELRSEIDQFGAVYYQTDGGSKIEITDFAIANSPTSQSLGFFALI